MHNAQTVVEKREVIGSYCGKPLHRWTEEGGTRIFEERLVSVTTASGTTYRLPMVFERPAKDAANAVLAQPL
jgi:hypothetical protein